MMIPFARRSASSPEIYDRSKGFVEKPWFQERFDAILDLEFPRVADVEIDGDLLPNFLLRCPNVRRIKFRYLYGNETIDLGQRVLPLVESIDFVVCRSNMIERVLDACPNVNHFSLNGIGNESWQLIRKLNQYFADRVSSMESISMNFRHDALEQHLLQNGFANLWHLRSLHVLKIELKDITPIDIDRISNSFPNLQTLRLKTRRLNGSISALSKLKNLVDLGLHAWEIDDSDSDIYGFVDTSEAQGLRQFEISVLTGEFSLRLVMDIVERFPRLKNLTVRRLLREDSTCSALTNFAKQLRKFARRDLKIVLFNDNEWVWESGQFRRAIEEIRRTAGDDERRRGLQLVSRWIRCVRQDGYVSAAQRFRERIVIWLTQMYHRFFC